MTERARVGINLLWLVPGVVGGSEVATTTVLEGLAADPPPDLEHVLFVLAPFAAARPDLVERFETVVLPQTGRVKGVRVAAEQTWLPAQLRRRHIDVVHHAGGTMPLASAFGARQPLASASGARRRTASPSASGARRRTVVTLHDLQPFDLPAHFHPAKRAWLRAVVPASLRAADVVVTPSAWVRGTVIDRYGLDPERIHVVHHGLPPVPEPTGAATLRRRYDLPGRIVVYPAITYPHKDHVTLVRAFAALVADHDDLTLVLTHRAEQAEGEVRAEIDRLGIGHRVRRTGRIPFPDVAGLVALADVLAFPSRYEGFGLPVLEAMASGTPVVAADATALPEVIGDGGRLVPPGAVDAWAAALAAVLDDPAEAARLSAAGRRRAARFTAAASAA
ncbi:MAG TPA: glycosyltransferase family 1 protein, partial [Acidimicrobiales bacterium]|nr:glycosyltransferase family 1 protein [Acidimicrobiales bacterium]